MTDPDEPHKNSEPHKNDEPSKDLDEELIAMLKHLRLGRLLSHWDETWPRRERDVTRPSGC